MTAESERVAATELMQRSERERYEAEMVAANWKARMAALQDLRESFPPATVGKLPRSTCKACSDAPRKVCDQHSKRDCNVCGNYMSTAHIHLDYVGHAEVTDRLLSVDPEWAWEPVAWTDAGLPLVTKGASGEWALWIRLTVHGVTRLGVGTVSGGFDVEKQLIGDALRNAAMRFGVALELWAKSELESAVDETPPPEPLDPERIRRKELASRARALPEHEYERFKAWLADSGYPAVPKDFDDDQVAAAEEWVTNAESAVEHDAEVAAEAAERPVAATEGVTAPTVADKPDSGAMDPRAAAAAHYVKGLDSAQLLAEFARRRLRAPRPVGEQRIALAAALVDDPEWEPPPQ